MIRKELVDQWFLIPQPEHARLSGFLAGHWGGENFACPEPWDEIVLATLEHDNGWKEWDSRPSLSAEGAPAFMYENPIQEVFRISHRGIGRLRDQGHPYAAALVSRHYVNWATDIITGVRKIRPVTPELKSEIEAYRDNEERRQREICEELRDRPEWAEHATEKALHRKARYVWTFDMLSLIPCCGWFHLDSLREVPIGDGYGTLTVKGTKGTDLTVTPWPFSSDRLEFSVRGRRFPKRPFHDLKKFHEAYEKTTVSEISFRYSPG